ncbi:MAG: DNA gyrase subunit A [Nitrospirae bacterium]|nr:DNA gyrase subunit A [Nitrospirota bacterium]
MPDVLTPQGPQAPPPQTVAIEDEMQGAYLDYAMSVIVGRALPDSRDGLKPVHRRILYAMFREGLLSSRRYSKSAGVVGEVIKKYHPHGDAAVYDALVRMVQDFNLRYPLIDGQGNFGSVDGDPAAAYRYTEVRLTKLAEEMLADIDMDTVDFSPNYDDSTLEPLVLPSRIPNLLINGSAGIAVGMATNIPPHNLGEVIDASLILLERRDATIDELTAVIKGPDFPTAGFIYGARGIGEAYRTGRGSLTLRARALIEVHPKTERESIIVTELPYQVNKARLLEKIAELVRDRRIDGITDLRDESDREGMRVVIELRRGESAQIILNQLYKLTALQSTFGVIMLSLVGNEPRILTLKELLWQFLEHRREVVVRRTRFELKKAEEKAHILEGLKIALDHLDEVIRLIRRSRSTEEARAGLVQTFQLTVVQANAILDMKLQRLTGLEREKLLQDYQETIQRIEYLRAILASDARLRGVIRDELVDIKARYADPRRTEIVTESADINPEDLIAAEEMVITVSHTGYLKRSPLTIYRSQRRGGKGKIGMGTKEEDFVDRLFVASTKDYLLFFTDAGKVHWLKVHQIPEAGRVAKGKAIANLLQLAEGEQASAILPVAEFRADTYVVMATKQGVIKKTPVEAYSNPRAGGIIALGLSEGDRLIGAQLSTGRQQVFLATKQGQSIRFAEDEARPMGRTASGVRGIRLHQDDELISMEIVDDQSTFDILAVTEKGFGKRTPLTDYRIQGRGGSGTIAIKTTGKNGPVISTMKVDADDEVMIVTAGGMIVRLKTRDIRRSGRSTQGVRLIDLAEGDRVMGAAILREKDEEGQTETPPNGSQGNGQH